MPTLSPKLIAALSALALVAGLVLYARAEHHRADAWQTHAELEASNHRQTKAAYRRAQLAAQAAAVAARITTERRYTQLAEEADHANELAAVWRDRAAHFADAGGLRSPGRAGPAGASSGSGAGAQADLAAGGDRSGAVTLTRADFDTLTANTDRLLRVHSWGERMVAEGWAVAQ